MAVTRIKNNQITDAVNGNIQPGINAAAKLQNYSITSTKIANSLVYGSDLTVSGNLTVNGTTTTIDTVNTLIEDPIITLADGQTSGVPTVDIGVLGLRGSENSSFLGWNEGNTEFAAVLSNTTSSNTTVNINSYANFKAANITATGNLSVTGNIVGSANFTGNVTAGNLLTPGIVSATGNATAGNILTGGLISATGNATGGNLITAGNVFAPAIIANSSTYDTRVSLNSAAGIVEITTNGNSTQFTPSGQINLSGVSTIAGGTFTGSGFTAGPSQTDLFQNRGGNVTVQVGTGGSIANTWTFAQGGSFLAPGAISAVGNVTGANILTGGLVSATGNVTGANILTGGLISAAGNITSNTNVNTPNVVGASGITVSTGSGNINLSPTSGNIVINSTYINGVSQPVQSNDVATKIYVDNMVSTQIAYHQAVTAATIANLATTTGGTITYNQPNGAANGIGATITTTGSFNLIDTANVQTANTRILVKNEGNAVLNGVYIWSNATVITRSTDADVYGPNSAEELSINDYFFVTSGNVNAGSAWIVDSPTGEITFGTSNIAFAQFSSSQTYTAGNGISLYGTVISTVYDNSTIGVNGSNQLYIPANAPLVTPNIGAATGTSLSLTGNATAGNILSNGLISASGNIDTSANINQTGAGNINGNNAYFTGNMTVVGTFTSTSNIIANTSGIFYGNSITGNGAIYGGVPGFTTLGSNVVIQFAGNANSYSQVNFQNINDGTLASTDFIATADNGTDSSYYLDMGINSSTFDDPTNYPGFFPNDSYVHNHGGNLILNPESTGKTIKFMIGGTDTTDVIGTVSETGLSITSNVTANSITANTIATLGNIVISGDNITDTNGRVNFNTAVADVDFAVNGLSANVFYVDAGANTVSFGNSTQYTNVLASFNSSTTIKLPSGTLAERPTVGVTGMFRFNTTDNNLEIFDNDSWEAVGAANFTVIADEQFNGDGSTVAFTLGSTQTTNSCIVSINGVVQIPGTAYSVSGTDPTCVLTFTEAPAAGDLIDVREITTTTTIRSLANDSGNAVIEGSAVAAQFDLTGNIIPTANVTYSLGNNTNRFSNIYLSGSTIFLGNLQLAQGAGNTFTVTTNGTTPAPMDVVVSTTGNVTAGNLIGTTVYTNSIINSGSNGTGNIGSASTYFDTVFAKATSAQYADLAEKYVADAAYAPGTVVSFGGDKEVTKSTKDGDRAVAGVVSTNPSYIMNAALEADYVATIALTGRVPTSVTGSVAKGDLMVSNGDGTARAEADPKAGAIIGKALENFTGSTGVIEVVIGRF